MHVTRSAMGAESHFGDWQRFYSPLFSFEIQGKQFLFGQQPFPDLPDTHRWFIAELHSDGNVGDETDSGWWNNPYPVQFPFTIGERVFFYGHNLTTYAWFIAELKPDGKLGDETCHGHWHNPYAAQFPFTIGDRVFFFGQNVGTHYWFICEINKDATIGSETCTGTWANGYQVQFPFKIGGEQYFYGQDIHHKGEGRWFIQHIKRDGTMGEETDHGHWAGKYPVQVPYYIDGKPYFFGQSDSEKNWFIASLKENGKMGAELAHGTWRRYYPNLVPFFAGGKQWLFGLDTYNWWSIRQLHPADVSFEGK